MVLGLRNGNVMAYSVVNEWVATMPETGKNKQLPAKA